MSEWFVRLDSSRSTSSSQSPPTYGVNEMEILARKVHPWTFKASAKWLPGVLPLERISPVRHPGRLIGRKTTFRHIPPGQASKRVEWRANGGCNSVMHNTAGGRPTDQHVCGVCLCSHLPPSSNPSIHPTTLLLRESGVFGRLSFVTDTHRPHIFPLFLQWLERQKGLRLMYV